MPPSRSSRVFIVPGIIAAVIIALELGPASHYVVLLDIGTVLDAANAWFFGVVPTERRLAGYGPARRRSASVAALVIAVGAGAILVQRYRTIAV